MMIEPNYPQIILSFAYRGCKVEIDRDELNEGHCIYAAWVNHDRGCAIAVINAVTIIDAVRQAKQWIDRIYQFV
ncbi:MAG: hypothetical protein ACFCAD_14160 [Pleurocapsa sp.]